MVERSPGCTTTCMHSLLCPGTRGNKGHGKLCPVPDLPVLTSLLQMIEDAGFQGVDYENLTLGVVAIHSGFKLA